jgi:dTMP kinase
MGKFVVIEGSDGSGKATQVRLLKNYLKKQSISHQVVAFPRYKASFHGKFIARYLKNEFGDAHQVNPYLISLAYSLDRVTAKDKINQWLASDQLVIADRYTPSNQAYQSAKLPPEKRKEFVDWLIKMEYKENKIPAEDLVLFLYVPVEFSQKMMSGRNKDGHESQLEYLREVEQQYLSFARRRHWVKIDCVKKGKLLTRSKIHQEIVKTLKKKGILTK